MKKFVMMGLMVLSASPAFAKISSKVTLASDFNWRGLSITGDAPVVQGGINYMHDSGLIAGLFASNQSVITGLASDYNAGTAGYLLNPYVMYGKDLGDINVSAGLIYYNFSPGASHANGLEAVVSAAMHGAKLALNYMPNYFGTGTSDLYANLSYKLEVEKDFGVLAAVGYTMFGDEKKTLINAAVAMSSYMDWKLALQHSSSDGFTTEVGVTDANFQTVVVSTGTKADVRNTMRSYVSLTKTF